MSKFIMPCPFCGGEETYIEKSIITGLCDVTCKKCHMHGPEAKDGDAAIDAWNTRGGKKHMPDIFERFYEGM